MGKNMNLSNIVKVEAVDKNIFVSTNSVKIILDEVGNLLYLENGNVNLGDSKKEKEAKDKEDEIKKRISDILHKFEIPAHIKGYLYIKTAIYLVYKDYSYMDAVCKRLYPDIAKIHETTPGKVERCIRHAIESINQSNNNIELEENYAVLTRRKLTNSYFIAMIADILREE